MEKLGEDSWIFQVVRLDGFMLGSQIVVRFGSRKIAIGLECETIWEFDWVIGSTILICQL